MTSHSANRSASGPARAGILGWGLRSDHLDSAGPSAGDPGSGDDLGWG
ncbi:hypothetical protein [Streptomyces sp. NPDC056672]